MNWLVPCVFQRGRKNFYIIFVVVLFIVFCQVNDDIHLTQTSSWLPPAETWVQSSSGFPYGWEQATDQDGKSYFINHLNKTTTYEDPRKDWTEEPPKPREVELTRHPELGFGFVAGSEKPVIVRFVTEGGPSVDKLQPGDQILVINGEDVKKAPRDHVIQLVRACKDTVRLLVCQPPLDNSARKSALLSAAKKAKLKSNPSRVRFAEGVVVNGSPLFPPSTFSLGDSSVPFMPNVLKVFLENGQTKSFKYDSTTLVRDVVGSLQQKLCIKSMEHFSLVVEHVKSLRRNKITLLDPQEPLARIAARPGSHNLRCLFRVAFVPKDACDLAQRDMVAFEYLYMQCCNDVVQERYAPELKYDIALRLAALHIHQHAVSNNMTGKITVKAIENEFGLERFVPVSLMTSMKRKELRKLISHFLKLNHNLSPSGQKSLTSLQAKLYYLNIIGELPSYGAKCFSTNIRDSNMERVILVSPRFGISQITGLRNSVPVPLADIEHMNLVKVTREDELSRIVRIHFAPKEMKILVLNMEDRDAEEFVLVLQGYFRLLTGEELPVQQERDILWVDDSAPSYHIQHQVFPAKWSYGVKDSSKHYANFSVIPNYQPLHAKSNGHFPSSKVREADKLATSRTPYDNNMNNMTPMSNMNGTATRKERNGFLLDDNRRVAGVTHEPGPKMGFDLQNVVSMEILESDVAYVEAKNEEVMRRVAEMQELVHSSEQYLTQQQQQLQQQLIRDREREREESDSESSHISSQDSDTPGQLKHSDSLLLLTQGQKLLTDAVNEAVSNIDLGETEPSESDTDSMSTPTNSPSHRSCLGKENESYSSNASLKASDSSFGLHSPDNLLPVGFRPNDHNIQDLLKRLQEDSTLPYNFAEGTLYLDPDIIDLTMIPPPITPDEDGVYALPPQLSLPPTPFADHFPLQTSLQTDYAGSHGSNEQDSLIDNFLDLNLDLEAFLATVTVPPPSHQAAPSVELTPEEIMSFIIPPPPANGEDTTPSLTNGSSKKNTHEILGYKYNPQELGGTKVIEYPTVNRKGGPFSCCGKYKDSPEKSSVIQPPPRNGAENAKPPARPPKTVDYSVKTISGTSVVDVPPILPPRSDASPPHGHLPRKPPLPPGPSQEILKKAQRSPIPVQKISNPVPVENGVHSTGKHSLPRNGYVTSRFINNREVLFSKSDATMVDLLQRLDQVVAQCSQAQAAGGGSRMDEGSFQVAKASLTEEARQLVTASKLLVKSATSPAGLDLPENLANCLHRLRRLTDLAADLTSYTTSPLQTRNLVVKVRDVASVFRETLVSALNAGTQESLLLARAENLASVLATLLRSLRVFSP